MKVVKAIIRIKEEGYDGYEGKIIFEGQKIITVYGATFRQALMKMLRAHDRDKEKKLGNAE